ncbi:MAG: DUF1254 domain-containing protein [Verrucomicrobia bacterium]|nr:DUF1254 domain-containing protein [Verrucomicrobiota bacterium]
MKKIINAILLLCSLAPLNASRDVTEVQNAAYEAYIYAYPLVLMEITKKSTTNVPTPIGMKAPVGVFAHQKYFARDLPNANLEMLESQAWVDLSHEPFILELPRVESRYYEIQMLDGWTNVFATVGSSITGSDWNDFAITGPNWSGLLPKGVTELKSPTNLVWIRCKTFCNGTQEDYDAVHELQSRYVLYPLNQLGRESSYSGNPSNYPEDKMAKKVVQQMSAITFFQTFAQALATNPPSQNDLPIIEKMASFGITAGALINTSALNKNMLLAFEHSINALALIKSYSKEQINSINGWTLDLATGQYGTDYFQRASVAFTNLGADLPQNFVEAFAYNDVQGKKLSGSERYVLHLPQSLSRSAELWSLTLYDENLFLVRNPLQRFSLNTLLPLKYNQDGSLDIYIQTESPGIEKESNWLIAPKGHFVLALRLYAPQIPLAASSWQVPGVTRQETPGFFHRLWKKLFE